MKRIRLFVAIGGGILLLLVILLLTTCRRDRQVGETGGTTAPETTEEVTSGQGGTEGDTRPSTETDPTPSESQTERETEAAEPHQTEADPETDTEPPAPVPLTAEEARALLSAALGKVLDQVAVTLRTERNGDIVTQESFARRGEDFCVELRGDGITEGITVVGSRAYYLLLIPKDFPPVEKRLVTSLTDKERQDLYARYMQHDGLPVIEDSELIQGILNGALGGVRYSDGRVELTCQGLDGRLGESLFGMSLEGSNLQFEFSLDRDVRVTLLRGTAYRSGGGTGSATVSAEMRVNYTPAAIELPADAALYVPTTYDEIFVVQPPEADPEAAASAGMPLDREHYTLIGGNYLYDPSEQYEFLTQYPHSYAGKTFTLYGVITGGGGGQTLLSLGSGMEFTVSFDRIAPPVEGSYVKLTATYRKIAEEGVDHSCYAMEVSSCEVLEVAKGPNGGKLMYVTSAGLNVRSSSDTSSSNNVIGTYSKGDLVEVFEQDGDGWYRVVYNGRNGYVNGKYLSETKP